MDSSIVKSSVGGNRFRNLIGRFRRAVSARFNRGKKQPRITVILNPASGQGTPDLRAMNLIFRAAGYDWNMEITNRWGDGARLARRAVNNGAAIVAAYGGDGTIMDVASGLLNRKTPLAILPGGTGNALAKELNIPFDLTAACEMMAQPEPCLRPIDLGRAAVSNSVGSGAFGSHHSHLFLLRFGIGLEAEITRTADRSLKDRLGPLAYVTATAQALNQAAISHYRLEIDGVMVEIDGLACMIANAATLGIQGLNISPSVRIDDGLLDVFVIRRADLAELASFAASMMGTTGPYDRLPHWKCRELKVHAAPNQRVEADGEELGETPVKVAVVPGALRVIVPE